MKYWYEIEKEKDKITIKLPRSLKAFSVHLEKNVDENNYSEWNKKIEKVLRGDVQQERVGGDGYYITFRRDMTSIIDEYNNLNNEIETKEFKELLAIWATEKEKYTKMIKLNKIGDYLNLRNVDRNDIKKILNRLMKHKDIFNEAYLYMSEGMEPELNIEGYTHYVLRREYGLGDIDAFTMLSYLRDEPVKIKKMLEGKKGG